MASNTIKYVTNSFSRPHSSDNGVITLLGGVITSARGFNFWTVSSFIRGYKSLLYARRYASSVPEEEVKAANRTDSWGVGHTGYPVLLTALKGC